MAGVLTAWLTPWRKGKTKMSRLRRFQARTDARRSGGRKVKCQGQVAQAAQASGGLAFSRNNSRSGC